MRHPNLCEIYGVCIVNEDLFWLVLKRAECNLTTFLLQNPALPYPTQLDLMRQAARAVDYLHSRPNPILHRDIKSSNFLVESKPDLKLYLSDFGTANHSSKVTHTSTCTWNWAAPEVQLLLICFVLIFVIGVK